MIYLDAIRIKIRENNQVLNRAVYIAVGVDLDGIKHVLGIWVQDTEGSAFWAPSARTWPAGVSGLC